MRCVRHDAGEQSAEPEDDPSVGALHCCATDAREARLRDLRLRGQPVGQIATLNWRRGSPWDRRGFRSRAPNLDIIKRLPPTIWQAVLEALREAGSKRVLR